MAQSTNGITDVFIAVEELRIWRLFNSPQWLAKRETCLTIHRRLIDRGLQVHLPDGTIIATPMATKVQ
jgi:hypothetical protein